MTEQNELATTKQETNLKALMRSPEINNRFAEIVGNQNASGYISSVLIAVSQNTALQKCTPNSIISCALRAATMRLSVDPATGHAYLVPFAGKATLIVGYKGIYQMALRTNKYRFINIVDIFESDVLIENAMTGNILLQRGDTQLIPGRHRGEGRIVGYLLYFQLVNGFSKTFYMTNEECDAHGKLYSKNYFYEGKPNKDSMWHKDPPSMFKKTVMRIGLLKWGYLDPFDLSSLHDAEDDVDYVGNVEITEVDPRSAEENIKDLGFVDEPQASDPQASESVPAPAKTAERPYTPDALKERIRILADSFTDKTCTDGDRTSVRLNLVSMAGGEDEYHTLLTWFTGKNHIADVEANVVLALKKWIHVTKQEDDSWIPESMSISEAKTAYTEALKDAGQSPLDLPADGNGG